MGGLTNITFGEVENIAHANWEAYSTCRGQKSRSELEQIIDIIADESGKYSEDQREDAVNDGLWDWLCHQYTLYTVTPIVLHYLINRFSTEELTKKKELKDFVDICRRSGTQSRYMTRHEITKNRSSDLPIFRIEDALRS